MKEVLGIIPPDGWTENAVIHGVPRLYPRVAFRFRPLTVSELADYYEHAANLKGVQLRTLTATHLARAIKGWDLQNEKGETVPLAAAAVLTLREALYYRLWRIVSLQEAPDEIEQDEAEAAADLQDVLKAAETGRPVAEVREQRLAGNSSAGPGSA